MKPEIKGPGKKPYQPPKFQIYGHLTEMTKTGGSGKPDRGKSGIHLT